MIQDLVDDSSVFDYGDDIHLSMTFGAKQGVRFVDGLDQRRPGGFALFEPFTFGIIFRDVCLRRMICKLAASGCFCSRDIRIATIRLGGRIVVLHDQEYALKALPEFSSVPLSPDF